MKSKEKMECVTKNGEFKCEKIREFQDGTREVLASSSTRVDANCEESYSHMSGEPKHLDDLHRHMSGKLAIKCKRKMESPMPEE